MTKETFRARMWNARGSIVRWWEPCESVQIAMARADREEPKGRVDVRSNMTSDGTEWEPGHGRLVAERTYDGKWRYL
jgi:hypothetical protein